MRQDTHRHTDMLELHACSEEKVRHTQRRVDMIELHTGSEDDVRHAYKHTME